MDAQHSQENSSIEELKTYNSNFEDNILKQKIKKLYLKWLLILLFLMLLVSLVISIFYRDRDWYAWFWILIFNAWIWSLWVFVLFIISIIIYKKNKPQNKIKIIILWIFLPIIIWLLTFWWCWLTAWLYEIF